MSLEMLCDGEPVRGSLDHAEVGVGSAEGGERRIPHLLNDNVETLTEIFAAPVCEPGALLCRSKDGLRAELSRDSEPPRCSSEEVDGL